MRLRSSLSISICEYTFSHDFLHNLTFSLGNELDETKSIETEARAFFLVYFFLFVLPIMDTVVDN